MEYEDLKTLIFGDVISIGIHRKVRIYKLDESLVIKLAFETPNINILEDEIWMMVKETNIEKWFAPCVAISKCGMFLLQKRIERIPKNQYPKYVPSFFGDLKYENFGMLNGNFVCCDYAGFISTSMSHKWSEKLKKANWWN